MYELIQLDPAYKTIEHAYTVTDAPKKGKFSKSIYSGTSPLQNHSGPKIYVVKQGYRCPEVFKIADKLACRDFRRTIEHRPMEVQSK